MNDVDRVRILLLSRNEYLPSPPISRVYEGALPGPQASVYVPCEDCSRSGRVRNRQACVVCVQALQDGRRVNRRHGCSPCPACDGGGERRRRRGEPQHDAYSGLPLDEAVRAREDDLLKHPPRRWEPRSDVETAGLGEDPVWRRKASYESQGAYRELDQQLAWLDMAHQPRYELLMHWLDSQAQDGLWWSWSQEAERAVHDTIVMLTRRMRQPVRVPNWVFAMLRVSKRETEAA